MSCCPGPEGRGDSGWGGVAGVGVGGSREVGGAWGSFGGLLAVRSFYQPGNVCREAPPSLRAASPTPPPHRPSGRPPPSLQAASPSRLTVPPHRPAPPSLRAAPPGPPVMASARLSGRLHQPLCVFLLVAETLGGGGGGACVAS